MFTVALSVVLCTCQGSVVGKLDTGIVFKTPVVGSATTKLSVLTPVCKPAIAKVLSTSVVIVVGAIKPPPNCILSPVLVNPLSAVITIGAVVFTT
ncbi:hypothetical protein D3C85_1456530 [compost metagenome]